MEKKDTHHQDFLAPSAFLHGNACGWVDRLLTVPAETPRHLLCPPGGASPPSKLSLNEVSARPNCCWTRPLPTRPLNHNQLAAGGFVAIPRSNSTALWAPYAHVQVLVRTWSRFKLGAIIGKPLPNLEQIFPTGGLRLIVETTCEKHRILPGAGTPCGLPKRWEKPQNKTEMKTKNIRTTCFALATSLAGRPVVLEGSFTILSRHKRSDGSFDWRSRLAEVLGPHFSLVPGQVPSSVQSGFPNPQDWC